MDLFSVREYRQYLKFRIDASKKNKGTQKKMALAAKCHPTYFSQVIGGHVQLTPDHAIGLSDFWELTDSETEYFLTLVQKERAASPRLKKFLERRLAELISEHQLIENHIQHEGEITEYHKAIYYSDWLYPIVHTLVSLPSVRSIVDLETITLVRRRKIQNCLNRLVEMGVLTKTEIFYEVALESVHLERDSPFNLQNHRNLRLFNIQRSNDPKDGDLNFSAAISVAAEDFNKIRGLAMKFIEELSELVIESKPEKASVVTLDLNSL